MVEEWVKLLVTANFLDDDFTRREAVTCFVQSKTLVAHEFKNRERFEGATFVDFLEAIARITLMKVRVKQHRVGFVGSYALRKYQLVLK